MLLISFIDLATWLLLTQRQTVVSRADYSIIFSAYAYLEQPRLD